MFLVLSEQIIHRMEQLNLIQDLTVHLLKENLREDLIRKRKPSKQLM
jgi:hypothetical protein